jgi:hypothetical protein
VLGAAIRYRVSWWCWPCEHQWVPENEELHAAELIGERLPRVITSWHQYAEHPPLAR